MDPSEHFDIGPCVEATTRALHLTESIATALDPSHVQTRFSTLANRCLSLALISSVQ